MNGAQTEVCVGYDSIRALYPSLKNGTVFLDNAGGSQVPAVVADRVRDYMLSSYVQTGAAYETSQQAHASMQRAHALVNVLMNGADTGHAILGASTSQLCRMLADCYADAHDPRLSEIIVCEAGHESNVAPWIRLANRGFNVKIWPMDRDNMRFDVDGLRPLLTERTRVVAFPHVSNIFGEVMDVAEIVNLIHSVGARAVVDGVAYAPHRAIDVQAYDADWYVYSTYKVFGPHMGAMFGKREAVAELTGPGHFFVKRDAIPQKFELGGASHEGGAAIGALWPYLKFMAGDGPLDSSLATAETFDRDVVERAFATMQQLEKPPQDRLMEFLRSRDDVTIIGPEESDESRVSTMCFVHASHSSKHIAEHANKLKYGIRCGHFCSFRLCQALGLDPSDGVVRVSTAHYNTPEEIEGLIRVFEDLFA